jgi:ATP sulfurylase
MASSRHGMSRDVWSQDRRSEAQLVCATDDTSHPGVAAISGGDSQVAIGGTLDVVRVPSHYDSNRFG